MKNLMKFWNISVQLGLPDVLYLCPRICVTAAIADVTNFKSCITGEVDKLLQIIAEAEDKLSVMRKYYGGKKAEKAVL